MAPLGDENGDRAPRPGNRFRLICQKVALWPEKALRRLPDPLRRMREGAETRQARELLAALFAQGAEGIVLCDEAGRIRTVSAAVERDTGFAAEELGGRTLASLLAPEDGEALVAALAQPAPEGGAGRVRMTRDVTLKRRNGAGLPAHMVVKALRGEAGRPVRFVVLLRNLSSHRRAVEEIRRSSEVDSLTGLPNRPGMIRHVAARLPEGGAGDLALILVDVDDLKQVNDRYGHDAGDAVLRQFARRLEACLEAEDFPARQAGDEFALVLAGPDAGARVRAVTERLRHQVARPFVVEGGLVHLRASIGSAACPEDAEDASALIAAADQALFVAKQGGGNRAVGYTEQIGSRARERLRLLDDLQRGLEVGELRLLYQPVVDLSSGGIVKAEALVRWQHPELGLLGSDRFVPLAEEGRMIDAVGGWVLRQCCADLPGLRARFGPGFQASVNISPKQLSGGAEAHFALLCSQVEQAAAAGAGLILEITESALLDPTPAMVARLDALRQAGAQIALDDFGAGHTSLRYYLTHDFEFLKIDRAFLREAPGNGRAVAICETILGFANRLGATAIAEGIETGAQARMLREAGCRLGQGYLFSHPLPLAGLLDLPDRLPVGGEGEGGRA